MRHHFRHPQAMFNNQLTTLRYSTLLYSTLLYSTLLYSTLLYSTLLYTTLLYSTLLYTTLRYFTLVSTLLYACLYATIRYATLLYSTKTIDYTFLYNIDCVFNNLISADLNYKQVGTPTLPTAISLKSRGSRRATLHAGL
jgi:hypothetical protein